MRKHALAILLVLAVTACKKSGSKSEPPPTPPATIDAAAPPPPAIDAAAPPATTIDAATPATTIDAAAPSAADARPKDGGPTKPPPAGLPKQAEACPDGKCEAGLTCLTYYGIAGKNGPKFTSCEIPCRGARPCPSGQSCNTIADGPGQVCRP